MAFEMPLTALARTTATKLPRTPARSFLSSSIRSTHCQQCRHHMLSRRALAPSRTNAGMQRCLHTSPTLRDPSSAPKSKDRGPASKEDTQTDFNTMDILSSTPPPSTAIDMCMNDGFALNSGLKVTGSGVMLVGGEALQWRPWVGSSTHPKNKLKNAKGQFDVDRSVWGVLDLVWPKPDLLVLGTGATIVPVSPETRRHINELGIRIEVQDSRNAAAQFNLLATERGVQQVVAALVPIGWREAK